MFELVIDRSMYDRVGEITTIKYAIRKYKDRGALSVGTQVKILKYVAESDQYGIKSRVLVETLDGSVKRWVDSTRIEALPDRPSDSVAFARIGEITKNILSNRD